MQASEFIEMVEARREAEVLPRRRFTVEVPAGQEDVGYCKAGHALVGANLRVRSSGWAECVACGEAISTRG